MPGRKRIAPAAPYRPRVGDTRWFVEWCVKQGMADDDHPEYGCNPDRNVMRVRTCLTREEAERMAREVYPLDKQGAVAFWEAVFTAYDDIDAVRYPHAGYWEAVREWPEYYEGEE